MRIKRSPLAAKTHDIVYAANIATLVQHNLCDLYGNKWKINLLTDPQSLFDFWSRGTMTTERSFMIDVKATRKSYDDRVINKLGWISNQRIWMDKEQLQRS